MSAADLAVDIRVAAVDQVFGHVVELVEVVAGVVQVFDAVLLPAETEPFDRVHDGVDVFLVFFFRIGVVEAQMAAPGVIARQAEIEADRLRMADVQVAVRLRREAGDHIRQAVALVGAGLQVGLDDRAQEVGSGRSACGGLAVAFFDVGAHGDICRCSE